MVCNIWTHFQTTLCNSKEPNRIIEENGKKKINFFKGGGCNFIDILSYRYKILDRRPTRYEIMPRLFIFLLLNNLNLNILKNII